MSFESTMYTVIIAGARITKVLVKNRIIQKRFKVFKEKHHSSLWNKDFR